MPSMTSDARSSPAVERVTPALVLRELRTHNFAVLSTVDAAGRPRSAGVNYGVSAPGGHLAIYVMTRSHLQKARNIARDPSVALVVALRRRWLWFLPPATIQLSGRAEILDWNDPVGRGVFRRFWMGRRILEAYAESSRRGETRICFLKITPDPVVRTYMVGYGIWELRTRMESGAAKIVIPVVSPRCGRQALRGPAACDRSTSPVGVSVARRPHCPSCVLPTSPRRSVSKQASAPRWEPRSRGLPHRR